MFDLPRESVPPLRRLATDACSLILLQRVDLLKNIGEYELLITPSVWREVTAGSSKATALFAAAVKIMPSSVRLSADAGVIQLYRDGVAEAVLSDDGRILRFCRANRIPHYCCLSLLSLLVGDRCLAPEAAAQGFARLQVAGRYSAQVIVQAAHMLAEAQDGLQGGI